MASLSVGARLAGDSDFNDAIAGKPCSYKGHVHFHGYWSPTRSDTL